jgi:hypothetical protein
MGFGQWLYRMSHNLRGRGLRPYWSYLEAHGQGTRVWGKPWAMGRSIFINLLLSDESLFSLLVITEYDVIILFSVYSIIQHPKVINFNSSFTKYVIFFTVTEAILFCG